MSDGLNKVMIIGNVGALPEMRYTANGNAITSFRVAVNRTFNDKEETEWFSVVAWNKLAEICSEFLDKGKQVYVEGRMSTRSWDGPDGAKKYRTELIASSVIFLGQRGQAESRGMMEPDDLPFDD